MSRVSVTTSRSESWPIDCSNKSITGYSAKTTEKKKLLRFKTGPLVLAIIVATRTIARNRAKKKKIKGTMSKTGDNFCGLVVSRKSMPKSKKISELKPSLVCALIAFMIT